MARSSRSRRRLSEGSRRPERPCGWRRARRCRGKRVVRLGACALHSRSSHHAPRGRAEREDADIRGASPWRDGPLGPAVPSRTSMKRRLLLVTLVAVALGYLSLSYVIADRFTRAERHPVGRAPQVAATTYEDVSLRTSDGLTLKGWFFPVRGTRAAILIHGRHANRAEYQGRLEHIADFLIAQGFSVLLFDLRGHGDSDGDRFSLGQFERLDVASAIDFVTSRGFAEKRIALLGISLGAGTAIQELLLHPNIGALVSDSSYMDAFTEVQEVPPQEGGIPGWVT